MQREHIGDVIHSHRDPYDPFGDLSILDKEAQEAFIRVVGWLTDLSEELDNLRLKIKKRKKEVNDLNLHLAVVDETVDSERRKRRRLKHKIRENDDY